MLYIYLQKLKKMVGFKVSESVKKLAYFACLFHKSKSMFLTKYQYFPFYSFDRQQVFIHLTFGWQTFLQNGSD